MKRIHKIILSVLAIALIGVAAYFATYTLRTQKALAMNQQICTGLEQTFRQNYSEITATTTPPTSLAIESHFSASVGKCYIKLTRQDCIGYTCVDKTILYDASADRSAAMCMTFLERGQEIDTQCSQGNAAITQPVFEELLRQNMQS